MVAEAQPMAEHVIIIPLYITLRIKMPMDIMPTVIMMGAGIMHSAIIIAPDIPMVAAAPQEGISGANGIKNVTYFSCFFDALSNSIIKKAPQT